VLVTHHLHEIPPEIERVIFLKGGKILADGPKLNLLTNDRISTLFDRPIVLAQANGWYQALPGSVVTGRIIPPASVTVKVRLVSMRRTLTLTCCPGLVRSIR
jgi:energy-coupling factor transporter ATP-binding protein EcfA2